MMRRAYYHYGDRPKCGPPWPTDSLEMTGDRRSAADTAEMRAIATLIAALAVIAAGCSTTVLTLDVGTCFDDPETFEEVTDVPVVDCAEPHDNEVMANFDIPGDSYPGDTAVTEAAQNGCLERFEPYVGLDYASSIYDIGWLTPTADSWAGGDREVICFVYHVNFEKITGSVQGTAA